MFDIEVLDSWTDMDEREIKVGDTVRHMRAGFNGTITSMTKDRGRVVIWVNHDEEWMPYHVRKVGA